MNPDADIEPEDPGPLPTVEDLEHFYRLVDLNNETLEVGTIVYFNFPYVGIVKARVLISNNPNNFRMKFLTGRSIQTIEFSMNQAKTFNIYISDPVKMMAYINQEALNYQLDPGNLMDLNDSVGRGLRKKSRKSRKSRNSKKSKKSRKSRKQRK